MKKSRSTSKQKRPEPSSEEARQRMLATRRRDTPQEKALRSALTKLGLRYRVDVPVGGLRCRADVAFIGKKVAVFVDGCFWHGCPVHGTQPNANKAWWREKLKANVKRDRAATEALRKQGWVVLRFWTHEDMGAAAMIVAETLEYAAGGS